jgi:hypothetical protein
MGLGYNTNNSTLNLNMFFASGDSWSTSQSMWKYSAIKSLQQSHHNAKAF